MPATHIIGLLFLLQVAGCAASGPAPAVSVLQGGTVVVEKLPADLAQIQVSTTASGGSVVVERLAANADEVQTLAVEPLRSPAIAGGTVVVERLPPASAPQTGAVEPPRLLASPGGTVVVELLPPAADAPVAAVPPADHATPPLTAAPKVNPTKPDKAAAPTTAKVAAPAVRIPQPPKQPAAASVRAEPQAIPSLALATLEQRLKETNAIGLFTKIAVKNQVDDLLKRLKAHYDSGGKTPSAQLRQTYEQLLLKVHDLLRDGDPALASAVANSRDAIWNVLTDPVKFAQL